MKALILIFSLCFINFVFSNQKKENKSLLENDLLQKSQPTQDLLEVVEELESNDRPVAVEGQVSLQLKETSSASARQLAQMPEPSQSNSDKSESDLEIEEIDQRSVQNNSNLKSLIHESVFQRENARRDLDVYVEDQEGLSLQDVEIQENFGNVEVRWSPPKDLD